MDSDWHLGSSSDSGFAEIFRENGEGVGDIANAAIAAANFAATGFAWITLVRIQLLESWSARKWGDKGDSIELETDLDHGSFTKRLY